jgi:hypothetical protein
MPSTIHVSSYGINGIHVTWIGDTSSLSYQSGHQLTYNWVLKDDLSTIIRFGNTQLTSLSISDTIQELVTYTITVQTQDNNNGLLSDVSLPLTKKCPNATFLIKQDYCRSNII